MPTHRRADGFELSDDPTRLDVDRIHRWLSTDAYWAQGRSRELMQAAIDASTPFGVYRPDDGRQVAFGRIITDGAIFAYLCDVYVDRPYRGIGLGRWLVGSVRADLIDRGLQRFVLTTHDAQQVYAPLGFEPVVPGRWMESDLRAAAQVSSHTGKERGAVQRLR
jgi:GNAT superfamily N-acetyltransferase